MSARDDTGLLSLLTVWTWGDAKNAENQARMALRNIRAAGYRIVGPLPADMKLDIVPDYPNGEVVGPCVCGSWPGGECLRCSLTPEAEERRAAAIRSLTKEAKG